LELDLSIPKHVCNEGNETFLLKNFRRSLTYKLRNLKKNRRPNQTKEQKKKSKNLSLPNFSNFTQIKKLAGFPANFKRFLSKLFLNNQFNYGQVVQQGEAGPTVAGGGAVSVKQVPFSLAA
jgi:hypothetical protein